MNWETEEHQRIVVDRVVVLQLGLEVEASDIEVVKLTEELKEGILILLRDFERQATEIKDRREAEWQQEMYRRLQGVARAAPVVSGKLLWGVDIGDSGGDHSAYTVLGGSETEAKDGPESETT
jgi:hypothetical protein